MVDFLSAAGAPPIRAQISRCVHPDELGKVFAVLSSTEALVPILASTIYSKVYLATVDTAVPGATYFMSAAITCVPLVLST